MEEPDLLDLFVRPLHQARMAYLVGGSLGAMLYSEPRFTLDIDLAVLLGLRQVQLLPTLFPAPDYYCPPLEVLNDEFQRDDGAHFNVIHVASGYKGDFYPSQNDPFFRWALGRRRRVQVRGAEVDYAPPEYIIVWKVAFFAEGGSEKHVRDIRRMLEVSAEEIDHQVLHKELERRGLAEPYERIQSA